jgi:hypothetical protein
MLFKRTTGDEIHDRDSLDGVGVMNPRRSPNICGRAHAGEMPFTVWLRNTLRLKAQEIGPVPVFEAQDTSAGDTAADRREGAKDPRTEDAVKCGGNGIATVVRNK